jgi:DMSO/TMAO reductase YedYZ heme-binding membrane subunit
VIALYIIVVVQVSSLMMRKLPRKVWHTIHLFSYVSFLMATVHAVMAGTDRGNIVFIAAVSAMTGGIVLAGVGRALHANGKSKIKRTMANSA